MDFELKRKIKLSYDMRINEEYLARFDARLVLATLFCPKNHRPRRKKEALQLCKDWIYALNHWLRCNDRVLCRTRTAYHADEPWIEVQ